MTKLYKTNGCPILLNDIVYDHFVEIKATISGNIVGIGFSVYDPTTQKTKSLGAYIFKHIKNVSRHRINPRLIIDNNSRYYDYTIANMKLGAKFNDIITDSGKKIKTPNSVKQIAHPVEMIDIEKRFYRMGEVERSFIEEICEDVFGVAKKLEIDSNTISDMVLYLIEEKRKKYSNKQKIFKLKSDIIDKEKEIEIIASGYYK